VSHPDDWAKWLTNAGVDRSFRNNSPMACFVAGTSRYLDVLFKDNGGGKKGRKVFWKRKWVQVPVKPKLTNLNEVNIIDIERLYSVYDQRKHNSR
jgi:hypothetical protein